MKTIALIPARKGSARVPGKNMALLNGRPLLWYAIRGAKESGQFDRIVVSTDWNECVTLAENMGVDALLRPDELCTDQAHDYQWVRHAIDAHPSYDAFVILRPTSPFRTAETIKRAMDDFRCIPCDSMRAVEKTTAHPKKSWDVDGVYMFPYEEGDRGGFPYYDLATQMLGPVYVQNGCIHIAWTATLEKFGNVSGERIRPFFTEGNEGVDINTPQDLEYAKWLMGRGK